MASDLPTDFDFIVLGTGLTETILAAAFSRIGHKVLHLDRNDHYSDYWASFNLRGFEKLSDKQKVKDEVADIKDIEEKIKDGEKLLKLPQVNSLVEDLTIEYYVENKAREVTVVKDLEVELQSIKVSEEESRKPDSDSSNEKKNLDEENNQCIDQNESNTTCTKVVSDNVVSSNNSNVSSGNIKTDPEDNSNNTPSSQEASTPVPPKSSIEEEQAVRQRKIWTKDDIQNSWRSFNLDLAPKVLYSSGKMVELLISSDVAKYCEFRTVSRVLTLNDTTNQIEKIPCSRADVFSSKDVSMLDKRKLMKFLEWCAGYHKNPEAYKEYEDKTFHEILKSRNLSENLQNIIQNAIAMVTNDDSSKQGLEKTQIFLQSVGRYGNTPFLFPLYGSGELPQAFCRLCAVFGGTYCLMCPVHSILIDGENRCQGIITGAGQRINCKWLIMGTSYSPEQYIVHNTKKISRCILFTDRSMLDTETQELSLLWIPSSGESSQPISVIELPQSAMVCPKHMYVVHLTTVSYHDNPEVDFSPFIQKYFSVGISQDNSENSKPNILWSAYFTQPNDTVNQDSVIPDNIFIIQGPDTSIDIDKPAVQAKEIFEKICPDEDFLPKPPHPDDIIYVDESEATVGGGETWDGQKEGSAGHEDASKTQEVQEAVSVEGDDSKTVQVEKAEETGNGKEQKKDTSAEDVKDETGEQCMKEGETSDEHDIKAAHS